MPAINCLTLLSLPPSLACSAHSLPKAAASRAPPRRLPPPLSIYSHSCCFPSIRPPLRSPRPQNPSPGRIAGRLRCVSGASTAARLIRLVGRAPLSLPRFAPAVRRGEHRARGNGELLLLGRADQGWEPSPWRLRFVRPSPSRCLVPLVHGAIRGGVWAIRACWLRSPIRRWAFEM